MNWYECTATNARTGRPLYCRIFSDRLYGAYLKFREWNRGPLENVTITRAGADNG